MQADLTGLTETSGGLGVWQQYWLVGWSAGRLGHEAARIMAVIAGSRVPGATRRDAGAILGLGLGLGLGPAGLAQGLNTNAMSGCGSREIASEAVSLYGGRLSHWPGLVGCASGRQFG